MISGRHRDRRLGDTVNRARVRQLPGWGAGRLEEGSEEAWITADPREDLLTDAPEDLWAALDRKGGWHRVIARMPADPSLNWHPLPSGMAKGKPDAPRPRADRPVRQAVEWKRPRGAGAGAPGSGDRRRRTGLGDPSPGAATCATIDPLEICTPCTAGPCCAGSSRAARLGSDQDWPLPSHAEALFGSWDGWSTRRHHGSVLVSSSTARCRPTSAGARRATPRGRAPRGGGRAQGGSAASSTSQDQAREADAGPRPGRDRACERGALERRCRGPESARRGDADDGAVPLPGRVRRVAGGFEQTMADQSRSQAQRDETHAQIGAGRQRRHAQATIAELGTLLARFDVEAAPDVDLDAVSSEPEPQQPCSKRSAGSGRQAPAVRAAGFDTAAGRRSARPRAGRCASSTSWRVSTPGRHRNAAVPDCS